MNIKVARTAISPRLIYSSFGWWREDLPWWRVGWLRGRSVVASWLVAKLPGGEVIVT